MDWKAFLSGKKPTYKIKKQAPTKGKTGKLKSQKNVKLEKPTWNTRDSYAVFFLFLASFGIYISTLAPSVHFGDSGELTAASYNLGIAHPPGYPLYLILGKFWGSIIPFGNFAYRMNLFSAFFGSLTVVVLYLISNQLQNNSVVSGVVGFTGGFGLTFWSQAVVTEVYTLAAFFFCMMILAYLVWSQTKRTSYLVLLAITAGLAMTHHVTIAAYFPVFGLFILAKQPKLLKNWRLLAKMLSAFMLPLIFYIYLPIRSATNPASDWGNPETFATVFNHVTARQFGSLFFPHGTAGLDFQWSHFTDLLARQWPVVVLVLVTVGLPMGIREKPREYVFLLSLGAVNLIISLGYFISDIDPYFIICFLILSILTSPSLQGVFSVLTKNKTIFSSGVPLLVATALTLYLLISNYSIADQSSNRLAGIQSENILNSLDDASVLFVNDEEILFPLVYFKTVERVRPEVTLYDLKQNILFIPSDKKREEVTMTDLKQFCIELLNQGRTVYFSEPLFPDFHYQPFGLVFKMEFPNSAAPLKNPWLNYKLEALEETYHDELSRETVAKHLLYRASYHFSRGKPLLARKDLEKALTVGGDLGRTIKQAAVIYLEQGETDKVRDLAAQGEIINPFDADFPHFQGMIYHYTGSLEKAVIHYNRALQLRKDDLEVLEKRGLLWEAKGDRAQEAPERWYKKSLQDFERCRKLSPNNPTHFQNHARVRSKLRRR